MKIVPQAFRIPNKYHLNKAETQDMYLIREKRRL